MHRLTEMSQKHDLKLAFVDFCFLGFFVVCDYGFILHFICIADEHYVIMLYWLLGNKCNVIKEVIRYTQTSKHCLDLKDRENWTNINHLY